MRIYPVVSNVINVELEDGSLFELHEGTSGLDIRVLNGITVVRELDLKTIWRGLFINLTRAGDDEISQTL